MPKNKTRKDKKEKEKDESMGWNSDDNANLDEYLQDNPRASADEVHEQFPLKTLKSVKAKLQYVRGQGFSK